MSAMPAIAFRTQVIGDAVKRGIVTAEEGAQAEKLAVLDAWIGAQKPDIDTLEQQREVAAGIGNLEPAAQALQVQAYDELMSKGAVVISDIATAAQHSRLATPERCAEALDFVRGAARAAGGDLIRDVEIYARDNAALVDVVINKSHDDGDLQRQVNHIIANLGRVLSDKGYADVYQSCSVLAFDSPFRMKS